MAWSRETGSISLKRVKRTGHPIRANTVSHCGVELYVPLQIAILKVLVSHPEGRATIAALNSDLSILTTSGSARTDRLRRLRNRDVGQFGFAR